MTYTDAPWLATGLSAGTLIWVTGGLYDRKRAKDLCRVRWIILCTQTKLHLTRTFWERSQSVSSYRAEMLGLYAMHTLAQATQEYYHLHCWSATLCCDNKKALYMSHFHRRRIKQSAKCADIHRIFRAIEAKSSRKFTYRHIYSNMDKYLPWERLSLIQQMSCVCDTLAKAALTTAINSGHYQHPTQFLPRENTALVVWGEKITGDISQIVRFHASKEVARKHLQNRRVNCWLAGSFNSLSAMDGHDRPLKN